MRSILCLSRAPLGYPAGIPAYCSSFYADFKDKVTFANVALSSNLESTKDSSYNELTFPFFLRFRTIALSLQYIAYIFRRSSSFSFIHYQHPDPVSAIALIAAFIFGRIKTPLVITWHADIYKQYFFAAPILFLLDYVLFRFSRVVIFLTPAHKEASLFNKLGLLAPNDIILPASLCISWRKRTKPSYPSSGRIEVLSIGRLVSYKGYMYAIKAINALNSSFRYHIVGDGPLLSNLQGLAKKLGCQDRIIFHGKISDQAKYDLLMNSHIFLFPSISQSEAYGLSQIEAMYFGLPIVNTELNNGVNLLAPKNVAITVRKKNTPDIVRALNYAVSSPELFAQLVCKSYIHYESVNGPSIARRRNMLINKLLDIAF